MFFVANWKMNPANSREAERLILQVKKQFKAIPLKSRPKIIICPPALFFNKINKPTKHIEFGVQNIGWQERGALTGEISALMAKDAGAKYCIVGHSERRLYFGENETMVNQKIKLCLQQNITPILCIGENLEEKKQGKTTAVLRRQLKESLAGISLIDVKKVMITYEPSWVISTQKGSKPETPDNVLGVNILIRKILLGMFDQKIARSAQVLYGGSVNPKNIADYTDNDHLNGFLIGSAGLNAYTFISTIKKALKL